MIAGAMENASHHPADFRKFEACVGKYNEIVVPTVSYFQALMEQLLDAQIGILKFSSRIVLRQPLAQRNSPLATIISGKKSRE